MVPTSGVIVPMVTPLVPSGGIDLESTTRFTRHLISTGVDGLLVLGSSGENGALSAEDRRTVTGCVVDAAAGDVPVWAGVASLGTADAVIDGAAFAGLGADALLLPAPYGFQLSPDELAGHFGAVADRAQIPVVAYEVPSRVAVSLSADLLVRLATDGTIAGVKDSSGSAGEARLRVGALREAGLAELPHFTGAEESIDGFLLSGGSGAIPGLANLFPRFHLALAAHAAAGDWAAAAHIQDQIVALLDVYFRPIPGGSFSAQFFAIVKEALVQQGVIAHNTSAAPFVQADPGLVSHVADFLTKAAELRPEA